MGLLATIIPGVGSAALLVASIVYFVKKEAFCPKGKRFDKKLSMCVDICAPGSRLNEQGLCIVGCNQKEDCPPNHDCVSGTCCDLSLNVKTDDGVCCPRPNVKIIEGKTACCPVVCGKECCSEEFTCGPTGKCLLKCGYTTCDPDESYCLSYPQGLIDSRQTTSSRPLQPTVGFTCAQPSARLVGGPTNRFLLPTRSVMGSTPRSTHPVWKKETSGAFYRQRNLTISAPCRKIFRRTRRITCAA